MSSSWQLHSHSNQGTDTGSDFLGVLPIKVFHIYATEYVKNVTKLKTQTTQLWHNHGTVRFQVDSVDCSKEKRKEKKSRPNSLLLCDYRLKYVWPIGNNDHMTEAAVLVKESFPLPSPCSK